MLALNPNGTTTIDVDEFERASRGYADPVGVAPDDWRRTGQEDYLKGVRLTWKRYQVLSAQWEHEHCQFCWQKFVDANYSEVHRQWLDERPDEVQPAAYTNIADQGGPAGAWWICEQCYSDFADEFEWVVVETDPDAWPYQGPEPNPRPTVADYVRHEGSILRRPE